MTKSKQLGMFAAVVAALASVLLVLLGTAPAEAAFSGTDG